MMAQSDKERIAALEAVLSEIATMKPEPITAEFMQGPKILLDTCQRMAKAILRTQKKK